MKRIPNQPTRMTLSPSIRFKILTRDHFTCRYCGRSAPDVVLHVDHVHPVSRGGKDDESNLVTACKACNLSKKDKVLPPREPTLRSETFPHVDRCGKCYPSRLYVALGEETLKHGGYVAWYRCDKGHEWRTFWAEARLTEREMFEIMSEDAIERMWPDTEACVS